MEINLENLSIKLQKRKKKKKTLHVDHVTQKTLDI